MSRTSQCFFSSLCNRHKGHTTQVPLKKQVDARSEHLYSYESIRYDGEMIAHLKGPIVKVYTDSVILDVKGVGYRIFTSKEVLEKCRQQKDKLFSLFTHLAVREQSLDLYGFLNENELEIFEMLIAISGIGPKSALAILNVAPVATLKHAIATSDSSYLTKVSGIGKKNAQKIILELNDKIAHLETETGGAFNEDIDTLDALKSLGYSTSEARNALKLIPQGITGTSNRLKEALKHL